MRVRAWVLIGWTVFGATGCFKSTAAEDGDSETESESGDSAEATDADPDGDTDSDRPGESDSLSLSDTETEPYQEQVLFLLENDSNHAVYLDADNFLYAERFIDREWKRFEMFPIYCVTPCDFENPQESCACLIDCPWPQGVSAVPPGGTLEIPWDGLWYSLFETHCPCPCSGRTAPIPGHYKISVDVYHRPYCGDRECLPPTESGLLDDRGVYETDYPTKLSVELDLPATEAQPVFTVTDNLSPCDDGSVADCAEPIPECDDGLERFSVQDRCYRCVNARTCKPWGVPGCETNADCDWLSDSECAECATSSCPTCADCVAGCLPILH